MSKENFSVGDKVISIFGGTVYKVVSIYPNKKRFDGRINGHLGQGLLVSRHTLYKKTKLHNHPYTKIFT